MRRDGIGEGREREACSSGWVLGPTASGVQGFGVHGGARPIADGGGAGLHARWRREASVRSLSGIRRWLNTCRRITSGRWWHPWQRRRGQRHRFRASATSAGGGSGGASDTSGTSEKGGGSGGTSAARGTSEGGAGSARAVSVLQQLGQAAQLGTSSSCHGYDRQPGRGAWSPVSGL